MKSEGAHLGMLGPFSQKGGGQNTFYYLNRAKTNGVQHLLHTLSEAESNEDQDWKPEIPFGNVRMEF